MCYDFAVVWRAEERKRREGTAGKSLSGTIPGTRKREVHCRAPGVVDFSQALVDVVELVRPGLTLMDGVLGQEGNGPGVGSV
jgi:uncharacterized protein (DUF362 family)